MARYKNINDIVNQVAVEVGIQGTVDVFSAIDSAYTQLTTLANSIGYELLQDKQWQKLTREFSFITQTGDTGRYLLPDDFAHMINQTGWDRTNNVPMTGPKSPQEWQYLEGRDLVSHTIYASFREQEGELWLFPSPPPVGLDIHFEYASRNWVITTFPAPGVAGVYSDKLTKGSDLVNYEPYLFERLLKVRFLTARGFDTTVAMDEYTRAFDSWSAKDEGSKILNAGRGYNGIPYLDSFRNTPDTNFGF